MKLDKDLKQKSHINMGVGAIKISNLTKLFKNGTGIKDVDVFVPKGSFTMLIGPNGAGKTTLIRCILRLYQKYIGDVEIDGMNNSYMSVMQKISYVNEKPVFPSTTLKSYLMWVSRFSGNDSQKSKMLIEKYSKEFDLMSKLKSNPNKFSSGEKQKVLLAKSLIEDSEIVIMDEPTSNMDIKSRNKLLERLKMMNEDGKTILLCTHNVDEVKNYATHVVAIKDGDVKFCGVMSDLKKREDLRDLLVVTQQETGNENAI